ncbi:MAG: TIGR02302 family protein [Kiloniellales bacterium]|nr:TIGR02302 family protein [Kiloniellales bacterium]
MAENKHNSERSAGRESFTSWGVNHRSTDLKRKARAARALLWLETVSAAVWPLLTLAIFFSAVALSGILPALPALIHASILLAVFLGFCWTLWFAARRIKAPSYEAARRRLEQENLLSHRPLESLDDNLLAGTGDRVSEALWRHHRMMALQGLGKLRIGLPHPVLAKADPWALRGLALLLLCVALVLGYRNGAERFTEAFLPNFNTAHSRELVLDAWISPPAYTGLPPLFLTKEKIETIKLVKGSRLLSQIQGAKSAKLLVDELSVPYVDFAAGALKVDQAIPAADQQSAGTLSIQADGREIASWPIEIVPDLPPAVAFTAPPRKSERLNLRVDYEATDDFGIASLIIRINRVSGPEEAPIELEVFLPSTSEKEVIGNSFHDLTSHIWAGLAVELRLVARDALGQEVTNSPARLVLPERIFEHPVARALVELRKQLTLEPDKRASPATALQELAARPEHYRHDLLVALALNTASHRLIRNQSPRAVPQVQDILWETALRIEYGELGIAERDLRNLQQALMEALASGADSAEIERLMDELQQALDKFLQALAEQALANRPDRNQQQGLNPPGELIDSDTLNEMIEKARELARNGARDAALDLLAQLQNILENLQAQPFGEGGSDDFADAHRMMSQMEDMLGQQQELLDRSFRRAEEGEGGQQQGGTPSESDQLDAEAQEALRRQLGDLMRQLGEMLGDIPESLGRAEQQMRAARDALNAGEPGQAVRPQERSLDQMQQGMQSMAEGFMQMFDSLQERGSGDLANRPGPGSGADPLGRETGQGRGFGREGVDVPDNAELQRSREVLDELRRRRSDRERPAYELDYLDRLLKQF